MSDSGTKKKVFNFSLLRRVFYFARPYKNKFYGSLILSVILAAMAPLRPLLIQLTINKGIKENTFGSFIDGPGGFIIEITIIQIALLLLETVCRFFFTFLTASLGQSVVKDLRITIYNKILHLNLKFLLLITCYFKQKGNSSAPPPPRARSKEAPTPAIR